MITGVVSTTSEDLYGDIVTREALESLSKQLVGLNVFLDHEYNYDKVIGVVKSSELSDGNLYATVAVTKDYQEDIKSKIEFGVNLGFSIGGFADRDKNNTNLISDFNLIELSLTPLPANWDSYGTVTSKGVMVGNCITQLCYKMLKSENMTEQEQLTTEEATNLFNELMANKEEEIESRIMEKVNNNIKQLVEEEVNTQLKNNTPEPADNPSSEEVEKHFKEVISKNFIELEANLGKQQEEIFKKYIKQSTPTPTQSPEPPVKKTYNNEQLYKQFKSNKGQNFFENLGFTE